MTFKVLDSGSREEFSTGSRRDTQEGKGRPDLISAWGLLRLAKHYENGIPKYGEDNWMKGQPTQRYLASMFRHLIKYIGGCRDEDHLAAIAWNAFSIMDHEERIARGMLDSALDTIKNRSVVFPPGEFDVKKEEKICQSSISGKSARGSKPSASRRRSRKVSSSRRKRSSRNSKPTA